MMDTYPMEAIFIFNTFFLDTIENYNYYHSENREIIIKLFYHNELSLHLYIFSFR